MNEYLYKKNQPILHAFLLRQGQFTTEISEQDKFIESQKLFVFGACEILANMKQTLVETRQYSVIKDPNSKYLVIPAIKLKELIKKYDSGFIICRSIAKTLADINQFIVQKQKQISQKERDSQEYCRMFANMITTLEKWYEKTRFPWLEKFINEHKNSLTYTKGMGFLAINLKSKINGTIQQLNHLDKIFSNGSTICHQGDDADELYILKSGKLRVRINNNVIDTIQEPGSVIGEMAIFLNNKRNATLEAIESTKLAIIKKIHMKEFCSLNPSFLENISYNLSKHIIHNCQMINALNKSIQQKTQTNVEIPEILIEGSSHKTELINLKDKLKKLSEQYDLDWIYDIYQNLCHDFYKFSKTTDKTKLIAK